MIMFFLPWWTYVLLGTIVFTCALVGQWLANIAQPGVEHPDDGPCLAHLGLGPDLGQMWCWLVAGHVGDHEGMTGDWDLPEEWPEKGTDDTTAEDEANVPLPALPQRVSKLPVVPCLATFADPCPPAEHVCWNRETGCTRDSGDEIPKCDVEHCGRWKGHGGTHW